MSEQPVKADSRAARELMLVRDGMRNRIDFQYKKAYYKVSSPG